MESCPVWRHSFLFQFLNSMSSSSIMLGSPDFFLILIPNPDVNFPVICPVTFAEKSSEFLLEPQPVIPSECITVLCSDHLPVCPMGFLQTFVEFTCRTVEGLLVLISLVNSLSSSCTCSLILSQSVYLRILILVMTVVLPSKKSNDICMCLDSVGSPQTRQFLILSIRLTLRRVRSNTSFLIALQNVGVLPL